MLVFGGGTQVYQDAVLTSANTRLVGDAGATAPTGTTYTGGGAVQFRGDVNGTGMLAPGLTIRTGLGTTTFDGEVGIGEFRVAGANVTFVGQVHGLTLLDVAPNGSIVGGMIDLNGGIGPDGYTVQTNNSQSYLSPVVLGADSLLADTAGASGGGIAFNDTVNGRFDLTINTGGATQFNGEVGGVTPLHVLTTDQAGITNISTDLVRTQAGVDGTPGGQIYHDQVFIYADTTLSDDPADAGGAIIFGKTVDSIPGPLTQALSVSAADVTFNGEVGSANALRSLTVGGSDRTFLNGGSVRTDAFQTYGSLRGTVVGASTQLTAGTDLAFATVLYGAGSPASPVDSSLTLSATGKTTFGAMVGVTADGASAPLTSLTTSGSKLLLNGGLVATTGAQAYNNTNAILGRAPHCRVPLAATSSSKRCSTARST